MQEQLFRLITPQRPSCKRRQMILCSLALLPALSAGTTYVGSCNIYYPDNTVDQTDHIKLLVDDVHEGNILTATFDNIKGTVNRSTEEATFNTLKGTVIFLKDDFFSYVRVKENGRSFRCDLSKDQEIYDTTDSRFNGSSINTHTRSFSISDWITYDPDNDTPPLDFGHGFSGNTSPGHQEQVNWDLTDPPFSFQCHLHFLDADHANIKCTWNTQGAGAGEPMDIHFVKRHY